VRGWHNYLFRRLVRRYYTLVLEHRGGAAAQRFQDRLGHNAAQYLWLIPNYDHGYIAVMRKPSKHHAADTKEDIALMSQLEKTT
jgi:hypothetical protein